MTNEQTQSSTLDAVSLTDALRRGLSQLELKNAPRVLYGEGRWELLSSRPRVSIVGSRIATTAGERRAINLAEALASRRVTILSGLARGIDTAAHTGAMRSGGETVGVIGTPLDGFYPPNNHALQAQMMRDYLVVSQFCAGTKVSSDNFPRRNRTMALLADACVIVEAKDGSGALHHAWEALRLGRPLFVLESAINDSTLSWPAELRRAGAHLLRDDDWSRLFDLLPID